MDFSNEVGKCLEVLADGGIILYPTDTIWGIGCDATNEKAIEKIFQLKNRPSSRSLIILVAEERDVLQYVANDLRVFDYLETTQRPTTVIYESAVGLPSNLINEDGTIAIRITKDPFCRHLIKRSRKPLVSTSANLSGQPTPKIFKEVPKQIVEAVDYVVKYRQDDEQEALPSSIIRWVDGKPEVIR